MPEITFDEWITLGIKHGFCTPPVCSTHDGIPMTFAEEQEFEEGSDPCVHIIRPYDSLETKAQVETNFPPAIWRDTWT